MSLGEFVGLVSMCKCSNLNLQSILTEIRDYLLFSLIYELEGNRKLITRSLQETKPKISTYSIFKQEVAYVGGFTNFDIEQKEYHNSKIRRLPLRRVPGKKKSKILKNDTKNIPKNYGKAILCFIARSPSTAKVISQLKFNLPQFFDEISKLKHCINSIQGLRRMWGSDYPNNQIKKGIRILSYEFMRKHCLHYIFSSKVRNFGTHIKYRTNIIEGIQDPKSFNHIKDY